MNRCEILNKLRGLAQKYSNILAKRDGVLGIVISGSLARGNVWEGSDVDLHVLWDSEGQESYVEGMFTSFTDDFVLRWDEDMLINIHDEYVGDVESIIGDVNRLCGSELPDQVYGCEVVFDPHGMWTRYKSVIDSIRFEPEFIAKKVDFHIQQALTLISKAEKSLALEDYASAVFHAQRAAIEVAFGATVECGGLIRSAQRFPENLKALAEKHGLEGLYERFRTIHGLTGKLETVEKVVVAGLIPPKTFAEELDRMGISEEVARAVIGEHFTNEALRQKEDNPESSIKANLPSWDAIKYGYYDGQIVWMRTNLWQDIPLWASRFKKICQAGCIDMGSLTIVEDTRGFPGASNAFYDLFLDFICLSEPNSEIAQERIRLVYEMVQSLRKHK